MHQIRVLFAYNKTQTRINNIITVTVHLISLLSIRTQAHLREGEKWLKKPNCRDIFMITKLKSKHVKGLQTLHAVLWIIDGQICRSLLKQWGGVNIVARRQKCYMRALFPHAEDGVSCVCELSQSSRGEDGLKFCSGNKILFWLTLEDQKSVEAGRKREREGHGRSGMQGYWWRAHVCA